MSVMSGMEHEDIGNSTERHPKLEYGRHVLRIKEIILKDLFQGGQSYIVQFEVLESSNQSCTVGETRSWQQNMTKHPKWAKRAVAEFVAAVYGVELPKEKGRYDAELKPKIVAITDASYGPQQTFAGQVIRATVSFESDDGINEGFPKTIFYPMSTPITSTTLFMPPAGYRPYVKGGGSAPAAAPTWQTPAQTGYPPVAAPQGVPFTSPPMPAPGYPMPGGYVPPAGAPTLSVGFPPPPPLPGR